MFPVFGNNGYERIRLEFDLSLTYSSKDAAFFILDLGLCTSLRRSANGLVFKSRNPRTEVTYCKLRPYVFDTQILFSQIMGAVEDIAATVTRHEEDHFMSVPLVRICCRSQ